MDIVNISPKVSGPVSGDIGTAINPPRPVHLLQRIVESKFKEDSNINALHTQEPELIFSPTVSFSSLKYEEYSSQSNPSHRSTLTSRPPVKDLHSKTLNSPALPLPHPPSLPQVRFHYSQRPQSHC